MKKLLSGIALLLLSQNVFATTGQTGKLVIESVAMLGSTLGTRFEVKVLGGFTLPTGVYCDKIYISTKNSADPDSAMRNALRDAVIAKRPVRFWITDNAAIASAPGRCSLLSVEVF